MNILIIDDEANIRKTVGIFLRSLGHQVQCVGDAGSAAELNRREFFDVAFLDLRLGTDNGLDLIPVLLKSNPKLKIIVMTAYSTIDTAVSAIKSGAFDYISKPFNPPAIELILDKVQKMQQLENQLSTLNSDLKSLHPDGIFDSANAEMQRTLDLARQIADSECLVLLRGESGTGKSVLAKAIHRWSRRQDHEFGVISCPSLSAELLSSELFGHVKGAFTGAVKDYPGRIAHCNKGTIFLDEIGDLPLSIQPQLLRFLQDKEYESVGSTETRYADVRIIAATNVDLEQAIRDKKFREDLFFRLNVIQLTLPPLRDRVEDILPLANNMLKFFAEVNHKPLPELSPAAQEVLLRYAWPGNLRELRNSVERAVILATGAEITPELFPEAVLHQSAASSVDTGDGTLQEMEKIHIARMISRCDSLAQAAEKLGIDQATLWRKRKQYKL